MDAKNIFQQIWFGLHNTCVKNTVRKTRKIGTIPNWLYTAVGIFLTSEKVQIRERTGCGHG